MTHDDTYEQLTQQADERRARLMVTLDALERRRHELVDLPLQMTRHPVVTVSVALALFAGVGGAAAVVALRISHRDSRRWLARGQALRRWWRHPDRLARTGDGPLLASLGRKILLGTLGWLGITLAKRLLGPRIRGA